MSLNQVISVCFFDDEQSHRFKPLTLTRPMDDLRVGILTIREKWLSDLKTESFQRVNRLGLKNLFPPEGSPAETVVWINSRLLPDPDLLLQIRSLPAGSCIRQDGVPLICITDSGTTRTWLRNGMAAGSSDKIKPVSEPLLLRRLWDLLKLNSAEIGRDINRHGNLTRLEPGDVNGIHIYGDHPVCVGTDIHLEPGVTFITSGGPVYIGRGATVMAGSIIRGPAAVCEHSVLKMGAKIYGNTTIGPVCKVGGEINSVIFHSYSNKAHEGYAGNSIFGQWCNLGADTNTSNLKNNYKTIRFTDWHTGEEQDTGEQFLGTVMADHGKTGINTMLNTGTNCGVCCNLFSHGYPPKLIPSFSWINSDSIVPYLFDKAVETMERTMKRRNVNLTEDYKEMMKIIFDNRSFA